MICGTSVIHWIPSDDFLGKMKQCVVLVINIGVITAELGVGTRDHLTNHHLDTFLKRVGPQRDLDRIEASGSVEVHWGGSLGTAETAQLFNSQSILILQDPAGLAEVVDSSTGRSMRGRTLTYDLAGDRMLTESERGGRTWITLDPESKDAPSVEP